MLLRVTFAVVAAATLVVGSVHAGCKSCQANAPTSMAPIAVPHGGHVDHGVAGYGAMSYSGMMQSGSAFDVHAPFRSYRSDHVPYAGGGITRVAPPAGTIGRTYQLPSSPVPADMHPRAAVLKVLAETATEVELMSTNPMRAEDLVEGYRDETTGVWVFRTDPLIPGNAQIYRVRAKYGDGVAPQDRYVRLIMGRVSALTY